MWIGAGCVGRECAVPCEIRGWVLWWRIVLLVGIVCTAALLVVLVVLLLQVGEMVINR